MKATTLKSSVFYGCLRIRVSAALCTCCGPAAQLEQSRAASQEQRLFISPGAVPMNALSPDPKRLPSWLQADKQIWHKKKNPKITAMKPLRVQVQTLCLFSKSRNQCTSCAERCLCVK